MAEQERPSEADLHHIKEALVGAGVLKSVTMSEAEQAKLTAELAKHGIHAKRNWKLICSWSHWCIVISKTQ